MLATEMMVLSLLALARVTSATLAYCNDKDTSCADWGANGECDGDNSEVVKNLCPHTCGVCSHVVCADRDESCGSWAKQGECKTAPEYMVRVPHDPQQTYSDIV